MDAVAYRGDPDGRRLRGVPRGVGEQVVQHLDDAPPVGHRARQVRRQVDQHAVPAAAAQEGVPGPLHQARDCRRFGGYRERPRVDAPDIEQVADQAAHVIGLLVDDAEELAHLGRVELRFGVQHGGGRTLDGGQRCARALAIAVAACEANSTRTSSSSPVNSCPSAFSPRKKLPTCTPRWRIGVACRVFDSVRSSQ